MWRDAHDRVVIQPLVRLWEALVSLFRDLAWPLGDGSNGRSETSQAQVDDAMDATLDNHGMDATGL